MEEALSLDIKVLEALLRRNRCSHGRTQYYKRISMAVRALQRRFPLLQQELLNLGERLNVQSKSRKQECRNPNAQFQIVQTLFDTFIPEITSRIQYAASALFGEIKRGFFLPLCTVAIGALARIRILVMRMARDQLSKLQSFVSEYKLVELEPVWFETTMKLLEEEHYTYPPTHDSQRAVVVLQSLGFTTKKSQRNNAKDETKKIETLAHDETSFPSQTQQADDIGTRVVVRTTTMSTPTNLPPVTSTTLQQHEQQDDLDRNLKLLPIVKLTKTDRKRTKSDTQTKKKKRKKEKKKDIMDQIFGDL
jgi:hypothetical protein